MTEATAPVRIIIITEDEPGHYTVREGDKSCPQLCSDEAMAQVARLLLRTFPGFPMLTAEEHASRDAERQARLAAREPRREKQLEETLRALTTNPHLNLGDLVYQVRERELLGWDGPAVKAWSDAVTKAQELLK